MHREIVETMKTFSLLIPLLTLAINAPVWSQSPMFLQDGPIRYFNDDDMALFKQTLDDALDNQADNEELSWLNEKTKNQGSVTPLSTEEQDGMVCRRARIVNTAKGLTRQADLRLCRKEDEGRWLFAE